MPNPNPSPKNSYEALQSFDLTGSGRRVNAGETFEATPEELGGLVEGTDYRRAPASSKP